MARATDIDRRRDHRLAFQLAVREGLSLQDASKLLSERRWADAEAKLAAKRSRALCGTKAPAFVETEEEGEARLQWWQR